MRNSIPPLDCRLTIPAPIPLPALGPIYHTIWRYRRPTPGSPNRMNCTKIENLRIDDSSTMHAAPSGSCTPQISSRLQHLDLDNSPGQTQIRLSLHRHIPSKGPVENEFVSAKVILACSPPEIPDLHGLGVTIRFRRAMSTDSVRGSALRVS
jgi:hypothetical protein